MSFGGRLRGLASDAAIYGIANVAGRFLTFFLVPIYTNVLTPAEYGPVSTLYSYIALAAVLYSLGFEAAYLRFAAPDQKRDEPEVFSTTALFLLGTSLATSLFIALFADAIAAALGLAGLGRFVRSAAVILFLDNAQVIPNACMRLQRMARAYAMVRLATIVANVSLTLIYLLPLGLGADGIVEANVLSSALGLVLLVPVYARHLRPQRRRGTLREALAFGLPLVPSGLAAMIIQVADRPILQFLTDDTAVGIYQANYKLGILMMLFVTVFQNAWQPFFLTRSGDADARPLFARVLTYYLSGALAVFLGITLFVDAIVRIPLGARRTLIDSSYWQGTVIVPWVLLGYVALGLYTNLCAGPTLRKKTHVFPWITGAAALLNVTLNLLLVPRYGIQAAGWTTFIAYAVMAALMGLAARRIYPIPHEWPRLARLVVVALGLWGLFVGLGGDALGLAPRVALLLAYPGLVLATGFLDAAETHALRGWLRLGSRGPTT